jgi:mannose-6-phosphate isomerase-like protein (cupin superfamily)
VEAERVGLSLVRAWHDAVNGGEIDRLAELLDDDVEFGGPRGSGRGATVVLDWARHSGIHLEPYRWFQRGNDVVVEEIATWQLPDAGELAPPSDVSTHFKVRNDLVRRVMRYDTLQEALAAAGLNESNDARPAPAPELDSAPTRVASVLPVINRDELPIVAGAHELEGYLHGDAPISIIFVDGPPGSGPSLHRHPYAEIFVVQEGRATFTVGDATFDVIGGQIAVAPAGVPHKFTNSGNGPLRQIDIHANDRFVTEWLEE